VGQSLFQPPHQKRLRSLKVVAAHDDNSLVGGNSSNITTDAVVLNDHHERIDNLLDCDHGEVLDDLTHGIQDRGVSGGGGHAVDTDTMVGSLALLIALEGAGEAADTKLGGCVHGSVPLGFGDQASNGRGVDNDTTTALDTHGLDGAAGTFDDSCQVDGDQAGPVGLSLSVRGTGKKSAGVLGNTGVVHHNVNSAKVLLGSLEKVVDLLKVGDIATDKVCDLGVLAVKRDSNRGQRIYERKNHGPSSYTLHEMLRTYLAFNSAAKASPALTATSPMMTLAL